MDAVLTVAIAGLAASALWGAATLSPSDAIESHRWTYDTRGSPFVPWGNVTASGRTAYLVYSYMLPTVLEASPNSWTYEVTYRLHFKVIQAYILLASTLAVLWSFPKRMRHSIASARIGVTISLYLLVRFAMEQSENLYKFFIYAFFIGLNF